MAKKFYATTNIKHGSRIEDGSQDGKVEEKTFAPDDEVTGLSPEDMKTLWQAGALTQDEPKKKDDEVEQNDTSSDPDKDKATKPTKATPPKAPTQ
jgi:hypothetical protein